MRDEFDEGGIRHKLFHLVQTLVIIGLPEFCKAPFLFQQRDHIHKPFFAVGMCWYFCRRIWGVFKVVPGVEVGRHPAFGAQGPGGQGALGRMSLCSALTTKLAMDRKARKSRPRSLICLLAASEEARLDGPVFREGRRTQQTRLVPQNGIDLQEDGAGEGHVILQVEMAPTVS